MGMCEMGWEKWLDHDDDRRRHVSTNDRYQDSARIDTCSLCQNMKYSSRRLSADASFLPNIVSTSAILLLFQLHHPIIPLCPYPSASSNPLSPQPYSTHGKKSVAAIEINSTSDAYGVEWWGSF